MLATQAPAGHALPAPAVAYRLAQVVGFLPAPAAAYRLDPGAGFPPAPAVAYRLAQVAGFLPAQGTIGAVCLCQLDPYLSRQSADTSL